MQPNPRTDTSNIPDSTYERIRPPKAQPSLESDVKEEYHYIHIRMFDWYMFTRNNLYKMKKNKMQY